MVPSIPILCGWDVADPLAGGEFRIVFGRVPDALCCVGGRRSYLMPLLIDQHKESKFSYLSRRKALMAIDMQLNLRKIEFSGI